MEEERRIREMLLSKAVDYLPEACQLNDNMARNPEIGSQEYNSSSAIVELLRKYGIETEYPFAGFATAFKGIINPKKEKRMAVLAEYDALRGMGHACGHCASGSASVMAALAFHSVEDQLPFGVDIIGTPDEEIIGVKCLMADQGIFDGYDFAIMVHMGGASMIDVNFIALDGLQFIWHGASAHAASAPEQGRNALNAARLFMDATDMMRQHIIQEARIHGVIRDGGIASNIVPDRAEVEFLTRAPKRVQLNDITQWVKECAQAAAMATRTQVEVHREGEPYHELYISPSGRSALEESYRILGLPLEQGTVGMTGSSDIGNVDYHCPTFHPIMGIGREVQCHTPEFAEEMTKPNTHAAIKNSADLILTMAAKLYGNPDLMEQVKAEHRAYRQGT